MAGLIAEYFLSDIQEIILKNNDIVNGVKDHSQYVVGGNFVNIPQGWAAPGTILVNPAIGTIPQASASRTDTNLRYELRTLATVPQTISNLEQVQIAYDKRMSVMRTQITNIVNAGFDWILYDWMTSPASGNTVFTSGASRPAIETGYQTGNRKKFTVQDLWSANVLLDQQRIPKDGRVAIIPTSFARDIKEIGQFVNGTGFVSTEIASEMGYKGFVRMLDNTVIIQRSTVGVATVTTGATSGLTSIYTPDQYSEVATLGTIVSGTSSDVAVLYHPEFLSYAFGTTDVFYQERNPLYYGDLISIMLRTGGTTMYQDGRGVASYMRSDCLILN